MADKGASISIDATSFLKGLKLADVRVRNSAQFAMNDNRLDLEKDSKQLVPKDEGTLESSGTSNQPKWKLARNQLEAEVGFNTDYAVAVHELMFPAIAVISSRSGGGVSALSPGPTTQAKPGNIHGPAGGKYLERPLIGNARKYSKHMADQIKRGLG